MEYFLRLYTDYKSEEFFYCVYFFIFFVIIYCLGSTLENIKINQFTNYCCKELSRILKGLRETQQKVKQTIQTKEEKFLDFLKRQSEVFSINFHKLGQRKVKLKNKIEEIITFLTLSSNSNKISIILHNPKRYFSSFLKEQKHVPKKPSSENVITRSQIIENISLSFANTKLPKYSQSSKWTQEAKEKILFYFFKVFSIMSFDQILERMTKNLHKNTLKNTQKKEFSLPLNQIKKEKSGPKLQAERDLQETKRKKLVLDYKLESELDITRKIDNYFFAQVQEQPQALNSKRTHKKYPQDKTKGIPKARNNKEKRGYDFKQGPIMTSILKQKNKQHPLTNLKLSKQNSLTPNPKRKIRKYAS